MFLYSLYGLKKLFILLILLMLRKMPFFSIEQLFQWAGSLFQLLSSVCSALKGFQRGGVGFPKPTPPL